MNRVLSSLVVLCVATLLIGGCKQKEEPKPAQEAPMQNLSAGGGSDHAVAGISWSVPERWTVHPAGGMRVTSYVIPSQGGSAEAAECAVFYFGQNQGGSVDDNINRWIGQFNNPTSDRASTEVSGMKVWKVEISGTYLSPGGPMMQSQGQKVNYKMLGAIIEAPEGLVFFKFTGPAGTINAAKDEFNGMIESASKS